MDAPAGAAQKRRPVAAIAGVGAALLATGAAAFASLHAAAARRREDATLIPWRTLGAAEGRQALVHAAALASNAHNTQPWRFVLADDAIEVHVDPARHIGAFDTMRREQHLSLGCAIENLVLAAAAQGLAATVEAQPGRIPPAAGDTLAARIALAPGRRDIGPLFAAIPDRHTHRGPFHRRPLPAGVVDALARLSVDPLVRLFLFAGPVRDRLGDCIVDATDAIAADPVMAAANARWFRFRPDEVRAHRDGLTLDANVVPPVANTAARLVPPGDGFATRQWQADTRNVHVRTAPLIGLIAVRDLYDRPAALAAGRLWQRIHLHLTAGGLAAQPLNQPAEWVDRQHVLGAEPTMARRLERFTGSPDWRPTFLFRAGDPRRPARPSPRRPVAEVIDGA